jgi:hypothetical protein
MIYKDEIFEKQNKNKERVDQGHEMIEKPGSIIFQWCLVIR